MIHLIKLLCFSCFGFFVQETRSYNKHTIYCVFDTFEYNLIYIYILSKQRLYICSIDGRLSLLSVGKGQNCSEEYSNQSININVYSKNPSFLVSIFFKPILINALCPIFIVSLPRNFVFCILITGFSQGTCYLELLKKKRGKEGFVEWNHQSVNKISLSSLLASFKLEIP